MTEVNPEGESGGAPRRTLTPEQVTKRYGDRSRRNSTFIVVEIS